MSSLTGFLLFESMSGQGGRCTSETLSVGRVEKKPGSDSGEFLNRGMSHQLELSEMQVAEKLRKEHGNKIKTGNKKRATNCD